MMSHSRINEVNHGTLPASTGHEELSRPAKVTAVRSADAAVRRYRASIADRIKAHEREIAQIHERYAGRVAKIRNLFDGLNLLAAGGFKNLEGNEVQGNQWDYDGERIIECDIKQLVEVRKLIGPVKATGQKRLVDKSPNKIWVYVASVQYPGITFKYKAKLPTGTKCKVKRTKSTSYSRQLVCEI